jgi:hypothetical protein
MVGDERNTPIFHFPHEGVLMNIGGGGEVSE